MTDLLGHLILCRFCLKADGNDGADLVGFKDSEIDSGVAVPEEEWASLRLLEEDDVCGEVLIGLLAHILIIIF